MFKMLRMELGITQRELADKLDISPGSVYKYENTLMEPGHRVIEKVYELAKSNNVTLSDAETVGTGKGTRPSDNDPKGEQSMDTSYMGLLKDKVDSQSVEISKLKAALNEKQAESTHWDELEYHFICDVRIIRNGFTLGRCIESVSDISSIVKYTGYSQKEVEKFFSVGIEYPRLDDHPVNGIICDKSLKTLQSHTRSLPYIFDSLKHMVGNHYVPVPITYKHKTIDRMVHTITFNKIDWRNMIVYSKVQFLDLN
tara:strand:+ start:2821 stop:3585 length:765 start_codon:yes stop_codon:yes gene_type:complete